MLQYFGIEDLVAKVIGEDQYKYNYEDEDDEDEESDSNSSSSDRDDERAKLPFLHGEW
jgi:hypothetical protein